MGGFRRSHNAHAARATACCLLARGCLMGQQRTGGVTLHGLPEFPEVHFANHCGPCGVVRLFLSRAFPEKHLITREKALNYHGQLGCVMCDTTCEPGSHCMQCNALPLRCVPYAMQHTTTYMQCSLDMPHLTALSLSLPIAPLRSFVSDLSHACITLHGLLHVPVFFTGVP